MYNNYTVKCCLSGHKQAEGPWRADFNSDGPNMEAGHNMPRFLFFLFLFNKRFLKAHIYYQYFVFYTSKKYHYLTNVYRAVSTLCDVPKYYNMGLCTTEGISWVAVSLIQAPFQIISYKYSPESFWGLHRNLSFWVFPMHLKRTR